MGELLFGLLFAGGLIVLLARYGTNPQAVRASQVPADGRARIPPERLRELTGALLGSYGLRVVDEERRGDSYRLTAEAREPFRATRYRVFVEAAPPGDLVEPPLVLELEEQVKAEWGAVGMLVTPYEIARQALPGLEIALELIDGPTLRRLIAERLPERLDDLDRYRGVGRPLAPTFAPA
jgi:hypothetical protein